MKNIENEYAVGDTWNNRSELGVEWRKLHYHMLHDLYGTLLLLVLLLGLLVKESERVSMYVCAWTHPRMHIHTRTHNIVHFSATAFKSVFILFLASKWTCISPSNDFCSSIKYHAVWYNSRYKKQSNNYCFLSVT